MEKKKFSISILLIFLLVLLLALVACDKTPAKYDIKNFYGTYDQFANDYYNVIFSFNGNRYNNDLTTGWWNICELKENSFVYIDTTGEKKEQECDAVLIAKIRELQQQIGHKVVIEKKKITFVDSNTVLKAEKTITKFNGHYYFPQCMIRTATICLTDIMKTKIPITKEKSLRLLQKAQQIFKETNGILALPKALFDKGGNNE